MLAVLKVWLMGLLVTDEWVADTQGRKPLKDKESQECIWGSLRCGRVRCNRTIQSGVW